VSAPEFAPRPQLADDVARLVRRRIFNGTYAAGKYIRLDQLAAELGISVTPVREALFELRGEGLLDQLPRRGFVVLPFTDRDITALRQRGYEIRSLRVSRSWGYELVTEPAEHVAGAGVGQP